MMKVHRYFKLISIISFLVLTLAFQNCEKSGPTSSSEDVGFIAEHTLTGTLSIQDEWLDENSVVQFVVNATDGSSLEYRWDFNGDGNYDTDWSSNPHATHNFGLPGEFIASSQIRDSHGHLLVLNKAVLIHSAIAASPTITNMNRKARTSPIVKWSHAASPDLIVDSNHLQLSETSSFDHIMWETDTPDTQVQIPAITFSNNQTYYIRVKSFYENGYESIWSTPAHFIFTNVPLSCTIRYRSPSSRDTQPNGSCGISNFINPPINFKFYKHCPEEISSLILTITTFTSPYPSIGNATIPITPEQMAPNLAVSSATEVNFSLQDFTIFPNLGTYRWQIFIKDQDGVEAIPGFAISPECGFSEPFYTIFKVGP